MSKRSGAPQHRRAGEFETIRQIRGANRAAGGSWFDTPAMRFFGTRVDRNVYGGRYFVTSEQDDDGVIWGRREALDCPSSNGQWQRDDRRRVGAVRDARGSARGCTSASEGRQVMTDDNTWHADWLREFVGRRIVDVRCMTDNQIGAMGWAGCDAGQAVVIVFDNGTYWIPMQDPEGNGPGFVEKGGR